MATERVERRLSAIRAADVVGYSRLKGADEEGTLARLNAHRRELLELRRSRHCVALQLATLSTCTGKT